MPRSARLKSAAALLLLCALAASVGAAGSTSNTMTLVDPLISGGPYPALGTRMNLYGQFVGAWDVEATNYPHGEQPTRGRGEWTFGWILERRAEERDGQGWRRLQEMVVTRKPHAAQD